MPEIPALPPELPSWRTAPLPAGLGWLEQQRRSFLDYAIWDLTEAVAPSMPSIDTEWNVQLVDWESPIKYPRRLAVVRAWAESHDVELEWITGALLSYVADGMARNAEVFTQFRVHSRGTALPGRKMFWADTVCPCGDVVPQGTVYHNGCGSILRCSGCIYSGQPGIIDDNTQWCYACTHLCGTNGCEERVCPDWDRCTEHGTRGPRCESCGSIDWVHPVGGRFMCESCAEYQCGRCQSRSHDEIWDDDVDGGTYICRLCADELRFGVLSENTEEQDADTEVETFALPVIAGRELIRHCGIEIEGGGRPAQIIAPLRAAGLTDQIDFNGYHHQSSHAPASVSTWSVEHDGSVDWELVSPRLNMADPAHVASLDTAVRTLRTAVHNGDISLDMRCGLHIHVSAAQTPVGSAYKLKGYWDYLEDVMFRLGAAKWPFHRAIANGAEYTRSTPKTGMSDKLDFARYYERNNDRYFALSFANYFRAFMENCSCGAARYDTWDNCTCDLGKCTFEFRVFNTSANPTKIHAYLALCQALVAKAASGEDIVNIQADMPPMSFEPIAYVKASPMQQNDLLENWEPRLRWLFNELPLTDAEKRSIMYCVENSDLNNLDRSVIRSLNPDQFAMEVSI